jgi:hypothetical protein
LTAETEHAIHQQVRTRPSTASTEHTEVLSPHIAPLLEALEKEQTHSEDRFQTQVCLAWIHWVLGESSLATARLPNDIEQEFSQLDRTNNQSSGWTKVCAVKAFYLKGAAQSRIGAPVEALATYDSALPILSTASIGKEERIWAELLLTNFCVLSSSLLSEKSSNLSETETLSAFRAWAKFWEGNSPQGSTHHGHTAEVTRRQVWFAYFRILSDILQHDLPYPQTALTTAYPDTSTRLQLKTELQRVEATYEGLLLEEVSFPKAEEASEEVERWVEIVMRNWRVLCGSTWREQELGEGGREAVSQSALDILYKAATKTFHSTPILRDLFTVHLAVAEFDLAFKAFDTYFDIVKKGKARCEKTGETDPGLDEDETVVRTISECIQALCKYGGARGAEKAKDLGHYLETWIQQHHPHESFGDKVISVNMASASCIPLATLSKAWLAVGISQAQWARTTHNSASRNELQVQAVTSMRKAVSSRYENTQDVEALFALGCLLAELRELSAAIDVVKTALLPPKSSTASKTAGHSSDQWDYSRERSLIPLWHLLALLLSARQEFATAARACEGAFEQFDDPEVLFGHREGSYRSEHLNHLELNGKTGGESRGLVDDMEEFEKEGVLEVKVTQLALLEVLEGPEAAVNASDELFGLYTRLFGDPSKDTKALEIAKPALAPPKSSAGTIRSIKGSIFGRSGRSVRKPSRHHATGNMIEEEKGLSPLQEQSDKTEVTGINRAPTIQVTSENGREESRTHSGDQEKLRKRAESLSRKRSVGSTKRNRSRSTSRAERSNGANLAAVPPLPADAANLRADHLNGSNTQPHVGFAENSESNSEKTASESHLNSKPLPAITQSLPQRQRSLKSDARLQDTHLPHISRHSSSTNPDPVTRLPKDQERRRRLSVLVKVWLLVAGFYRRASLFEDAKGAIDEVYKLVEHLEADVAKDTSGNVTVEDAGWGSNKSVEQLWGDVWAEVSILPMLMVQS